MRRFLTLLIILSTTLAGYGQYYYTPSLVPGNPGGLNSDDEFPVGGGLDASWTPILGPSLSTPTWSASQSIGFPFSFDGNSVTDYIVSSTGVLTFAAAPGTAPASSPVALPNPVVPDSSVVVMGIQGSGSNDRVVKKEFGSAGSRQHWVFFSSYTNPTNTACWHYFAIVLEEGTNNIYVVDMRNACDIDLTIGVQIDGSSAVSVLGSPSLGQRSDADPTPADNYYYAFTRGTQPAYDMAGISFNGAEFNLLADAPFSMSGILINLGSSTINSLDINYSIDGGTPVTTNLTGLSIAPYTEQFFLHPTPFAPVASGAYSVEYWASNLNGNPDDVPGNDRTEGPFGVYDVFTVRVPLYETFTSSTCVPCRPGNITLENLFALPANAGKFSSIKYQQDFPGTGDPYFTEEGGLLRAQYGINSIPRLEVDGGWDQNAASVTQSLMDQWAGIPAFMELDATYQLLDQSIGVNVDINPLIDFTNPNLVLKMAVFEYETFNNVKSNGETEFHHVMKKMLPDEEGVSLGNMTAGVVVSKTGEHEFRGDYRLPPNATSPIAHGTEHSVEEFEDLGVIVWVQDAVTLEVYQSTEARVFEPNGLEAPQIIATAKLYPNPVQQSATLAFQLTQPVSDLTATIYDVSGKQVGGKSLGAFPQGRSTVAFDAGPLEAGMYRIALQTGERTLVVPMQVIR